MSSIHRLSDLFFHANPHLPKPELTEKDKMLLKAVRESSDKYEAFLRGNKGFEGISDEGLKAASTKAEEDDLLARSTYLDIVLESRHDIDNDLLKAATAADGIFEDFIASHSELSGVTDQGLHDAISATEKEELQERSSYLKDVLLSRESQIHKESPPSIDHSFGGAIGEKKDLGFLGIGMHRLTSKELAQIKSVPGLNFWRPIKNDGNHYYRAAIFGLLEQILQSPDRKKCFGIFADKCERSSSMPSELKTPFVDQLRQMQSGHACRNMQEFECLALSSRFDHDMVLVARYLLEDHILKHKQETFHGEKLTPEIATDILSEEKEIPPIFMEYGLLGDALNMLLSIVSLETNGEPRVQITSNASDKPHKFKVYILNTPETYGLLYTE